MFMYGLRVVIFVSLAILASCVSSLAYQASRDSKGQPEPVEADIARISVDDLQAKLSAKQKVVIIDVRGADYDQSNTRIKGAIRIAPSEISSHLKELPRDSEIVTYCACSTDGGAVKAAQVLRANGFKQVRALKGGWNAWNQAGGPVESK